MSNGIGHVWAVNAEGGDEGRPNGVGPVWIENADQLGSKLPEPESGDTGKVLGVLNSDGDIGWVIDQSGTFTQVQADWDQDDSSQVSYIANKPSLATVATTGSYTDLSNTPTIPTVDQEYNSASANAQSGVAVAGAISGKQDTINDLETIRSGAAAGATAVQPAALNDYATTSALTSGLSTKQDTINDLETIRSGAAAGATAVQPSSLATVATTGSYTDLLDKPTIPPGVVVDQVYDSASTNAQSGTAVAGAISAVKQVPDVTSSDDGKVLKATYSGGVGSYTWDSLPANSAVFTVDVDSYYDILSAYNAGKTCFVHPAGSKYLYPLTMANIEGGAFSFWLDYIPTTYDSNQGIAERTQYTVVSRGSGSGWTTTHEKVAPYILAASRIATALNTDTKVLSVSADIPVITSGNDKVIDIADAGRIEVASTAFSGTATKTDTYTRDGYSFYTSDGSRLIGNKWTPFTSYMSGSYTVSFSGGDSSKNLTFTSAGAYTWDGNTLADPSAFPANGTIHYGLFQGELDANNRMTVNPTLIWTLIPDVANVTSADSSVSATVNRPENVSMTINVVAGKKLLTAFYVRFSGVIYFLSTIQNPFNKPNILISQQIGNIAKVVEEAPVDTKSYVRKDGAWVEASGGASYTAGDGIDITSDTVSVKAGTGLEIADVSVRGTANLVSQDIVYNGAGGSWDVLSFAPLTSGLLSQMANGMDVTTVGTFYFGENTPYYAALYTLRGDRPGNRLVLGSAHTTGPSGILDPGTVITFDTSDIDTANSTVTLSQVESNISNYRLGLLIKDGPDWYIGVWWMDDSAQSVTTATYTGMTTVQDALCVADPLPASTSADAGKMLTVNSSGAAAWGMRIQQVSALPANPDANTLYLIPEA